MMINRLLILGVLLASDMGSEAADAPTVCIEAPAPMPALPQAADTIHVAPPTGEREADRASILAALERVEADGTFQFAPGTYLVGEVVPLETPRVTLLGHPDGTTLRGNDPAG